MTVKQEVSANRFHGCILLIGVLAAIFSYETARAEPPRALEVDCRPVDARLHGQRSLESYFPFSNVDSSEAWWERATQLRQRILVATGLWPMPTKTPLKAVVLGKVERNDYTVEKVYFESFPGHLVTGNLYRPKGSPGPRPAVLSPHGHRKGGRFHDYGPKEVRKQIAMGAERFEVGGRHPLQARCVQLARMGCVVFHYDMVGYGDSRQLDHRTGVREVMNTTVDWGFFSPQAELHLQNMMGLQTYNSIRALDFLLSLPEVDANRVAMTGASGGGTQTFMLCAVDQRPAASCPVVMVSTAMQGGCVCENANYLRIGAGNVDLAALAAPRPLRLICADDWTREFATKGLPALQRLYDLLGHKDRVGAEMLVQFPHNYNSVSRTAMYHFINRYLDLGLEQPITEQEYLPLSRDEMSVWDEEHPPPTGDQIGDSHERILLRWMTDDAKSQIDAIRPMDEQSLAEFRRVVGGAYRVLLGRTLDQVGTVRYKQTLKRDLGSHLQMTGLLTATAWGEQLPALFLHPKEDWNQRVVIWIDEQGKRGLLDENHTPKPAVMRLLNCGFSVVSVDLLFQGEFLGEGEEFFQAPLVFEGDGAKPWKRYAGYSFGYNPPLFAQRVNDILTAIQFVQHDDHVPEKIYLLGMGRTGPLVAAARMVAGDAIDKAAIEGGGFRFATLTRFDDPMFLPGAVKYGDLPGLLALCAPHKLWLAGETAESAEVAVDAYNAADAWDHITFQEDTETDIQDAAVAWLLE